MKAPSSPRYWPEPIGVWGLVAWVLGTCTALVAWRDGALWLGAAAAAAAAACVVWVAVHLLCKMTTRGVWGRGAAAAPAAGVVWVAVQGHHKVHPA